MVIFLLLLLPLPLPPPLLVRGLQQGEESPKTEQHTLERGCYVIYTYPAGTRPYDVLWQARTGA